MELTRRQIEELRKRWDRSHLPIRPVTKDKFEVECKALDLVFRGNYFGYHSYTMPEYNEPMFYWSEHDGLISFGTLKQKPFGTKPNIDFNGVFKVCVEDMDSIIQDIAEFENAHKLEQVKQEKITDLAMQYDEVALQKKLKELGLDGQYRIQKDSNWIKIYGNGLTISLRASALFEVISDLQTADLASFFKIIKLLGLKGKLETK